MFSLLNENDPTRGPLERDGLMMDGDDDDDDDSGESEWGIR